MFIFVHNNIAKSSSGVKEIIYFLSFFPPDNCRHYNKYFSTQLEKQPILAHEKNTMNKWTLALGALTSKTEIC